MPYKHVSSSTALETSVALLRESIGPKAANAFVLAPLWVPGVGSIGLITIADIPYARQSPVAGRGGGRRMKHGNRVGSTRRPGKYNSGHGPSHEDTPTFGEVGRGPRVRYAVGAGVVDFARRVGVAVGTAAFHLRKKGLVTRIRVEGGGYSRYTSPGDGRGGKSRSRLGSPRSPVRPSPPRVGGQQGTSRLGPSNAQGTRCAHLFLSRGNSSCGGTHDRISKMRCSRLRDHALTRSPNHTAVRCSTKSIVDLSGPN